MKHLLTILTAFFLLALCVPCHAIQELIKQSSATTKVPFLLVDSATGQIGQTGKGSTMAIEVSINGASGSGYGGSAPTEIDSTNLPGDYYYVPTATETGTLGVVTLHITCASCQTVDLSCQIVAFDPNSSTNLGLSALPSANPAASGGLPTVNGSDQVTANVTGINGHAPILDASNNLMVDTYWIDAQTATATGSVAFPSTIGTSTYSGGAVASVIASVTVTGTPNVNVTNIAGNPTYSQSGGVWFPLNLGSSTYAGGDTPGVTTLLSRVPQTFLFDGSNYVKANAETVSDKAGYALTTAPPTAATIASAVASSVPTDTSIQADVAGGLTTQGYTTSLANSTSTTNSTIANLTQGSAGTQKFTATSLSLAPSVGGSVTGYAVGQDPATLVLGALTASWNGAGTFGAFLQSLPSASVIASSILYTGNKIAADSSGRVTPVSTTSVGGH